jgi:hypothetical protein
MLVERCTQKVIGSYPDVVALEKKFEALETKIGNVPKKRRLMPRYAGVPVDTMIWEREWESLSAIEAYQAKANNDDPEWDEAYSQAPKVFTDFKFELFEVITLPD